MDKASGKLRGASGRSPGSESRTLGGAAVGFMSTRPSAVRVCTFRQISGLKSQAPMRPITYMRVMRGEGSRGWFGRNQFGNRETFSSPHGSERHWSARQRLPRSKVSRWFDETVRSHRADNQLGLRRPGRAILASRCLVASAASWRPILANSPGQFGPAATAVAVAVCITATSATKARLIAETSCRSEGLLPKQSFASSEAKKYAPVPSPAFVKFSKRLVWSSPTGASREFD
jgi:hypothetical protein